MQMTITSDRFSKILPQAHLPTLVFLREVSFSVAQVLLLQVLALKALNDLGDPHLVHKRVIEIAEKFLGIGKGNEPVIMHGEVSTCALHVNRIATVIETQQVSYQHLTLSHCSKTNANIFDSLLNDVYEFLYDFSLENLWKNPGMSYTQFL